MNETASESREHDLVIVGGGAGGVLTALHALALAEPGQRIVLIEPASQLAQGVAYATTHPEHLLNVPARRMSAYDGKPDDFVDFLVESSGEDARDGIAVSYAERRRYGDYLRDRLQRARDQTHAHFEVLHDRVVGMDDDHGQWRLSLHSAASLRARGVVLAVGNASKPLPARGASSLPLRRRTSRFACSAAWRSRCRCRKSRFCRERSTTSTS
jgi:uncharacterized NAD(P)/FAD-binding protein YdhS